MKDRIVFSTRQTNRSKAPVLRPSLPPLSLRTVIGDVLAQHEHGGEGDEFDENHACKGPVTSANKEVAAL